MAELSSGWRGLALGSVPADALTSPSLSFSIRKVGLPLVAPVRMGFTFQCPSENGGTL